LVVFLFLFLHVWLWFLKEYDLEEEDPVREKTNRTKTS